MVFTIDQTMIIILSFMIKELAKEFKGEFNCHRKNTQKYKTFSVPITKEVNKIGKNGRQNTKIKNYKLQCTDIAKFIVSLSSNFVYNLAEEIHKFNYKFFKRFFTHRS